MILLDIKQYFINVVTASTSEVSKEFNIQLSAAQGMIDFWVRKGNLIVCEKACSKTACGGCSITLKRYRWADSKNSLC